MMKFRGKREDLAGSSSGWSDCWAEAHEKTDNIIHIFFESGNGYNFCGRVFDNVDKKIYTYPFD